jgi:hypothetical protein
MNPNPPRWPDLSTLVLVAGHAVYVGEDFVRPEDDGNWFLQDFQKGEPSYYIEHARCGVELAAADPSALLLFSGGQTRRKAGPRSEGQSYWAIANHFRWWNRAAVADRATTEEFARDSFENVLFGLCRFKECVGRYPETLQIVSWAFKKERFDLHRAAVGWPGDSARYKFHGANNPGDLAIAAAGESNALELFRRDPFGTEGDLARKRAARNPFARRHPYETTCPELAGLLRHASADGLRFTQPRPWDVS